MQKGVISLKKDFSIRKIDSLGRIVIPMDFRRALDIQEWDELRLSMEGAHIIVEKNSPQCVFCQKSERLVHYQGKFICPDCLKELTKL